MTSSPTQSTRYALLDEIRGFAVLCMVFYHAFYLLGDTFGSEFFARTFDFFSPAEPFFAALFVFVSGICSLFSKRPGKRALLLSAVAAVLTLSTYLLTLAGIECLIVFGIIHLLAACWILFFLIGRAAAKISPTVGLCACILCFLITFNVENGYLGFGAVSLRLPEALYRSSRLFFLGLTGPGFFSADYFPVIPWVFMFFAGMYFLRLFPDCKLPKTAVGSHCRPLGFLGRHALVIYVLHQPVVFLAAELISLIFGG